MLLFSHMVILRRSQRRMVGWLMNDELERIWKEAVIA
jgi:hypothetical protein